MNRLQHNLNFFDINSSKEYSDFFLQKKSNGLNVIDLFCGCGGFSLGFKREGYNIIAGLDNDQDSLKTFEHNLETKAFNLDLSTENWIESLLSQIKNKSIDILVGGPPCQGFSLTGTRVFDDPRNRLYKAFFDGIDALSPRFVLIENVKGMSTLYRGQAKKSILSELQARGYKTTERVLNSAEYGVPQFRERLFILGSKGNFQPRLPNALVSEESFISSSMAISDLPGLETDVGNDKSKYGKSAENYYQKLMRKGSSHIYNHLGTVHKDFVIETIKQVPDGGNYKDLPAGVGSSRKFNEAWTRYNSAKPSRTIDTGHRNHFHYKYNRVPTVRENARLQSFPDTFRFMGSKTSQNRQVGNAVPVFVAQAIAAEVLKQL